MSDEDFIVPYLYMFWGLHHREPMDDVWQAPSGMLIHGHWHHGIPFARGRLILIYCATKAVDCGQTFIGSLNEIRGMFQLPWPIENLEKHFRLVVHAEFECTDRACVCAPLPCQRRQRVAYDVDYCSNTQTFRVTVSREFLRLSLLGVECPPDPIRRLARSGHLDAMDLYVWYRWRLQQHLLDSIAVLSSDGPFAFINTAKTPRPNRKIARLHKQLAAAWPNFPFYLNADSTRIEYDPNRPQQTAPAQDATLVIPTSQQVTLVQSLSQESPQVQSFAEEPAPPPRRIKVEAPPLFIQPPESISHPRFNERSRARIVASRRRASVSEATLLATPPLVPRIASPRAPTTPIRPATPSRPQRPESPQAPTIPMLKTSCDR